jgi:hypothetical protein
MAHLHPPRLCEALTVRLSIALLTLYLLALGLFTALGLHSVKQEAKHRCADFIHGYELLGDELGADPEQIDRFVARLHHETDC